MTTLNTLMTTRTLLATLAIALFCMVGCTEASDDDGAGPDTTTGSDYLSCDLGVDACGGGLSCLRVDGDSECVEPAGDPSCDGDLCDCHGETICGADSPCTVSDDNMSFLCSSPEPDPDPIPVGSDTLVRCTDEMPSDPVSFNGVRLNGDQLELDVSYSGGCAQHTFTLCWEGSFAESHPVQTGLQLRHDDGDDECDAMPSETLTFDISPLKQEYQSTYAGDPAGVIVHVGEESFLYAATGEPEPSEDAIGLCPPEFAQDPAGIGSSRLEGTDLVLDVSYSGGCEEHAFSLCWDGSFMESYPVQVRAYLGHEDNDDPCDGVVNEEIRFDLEPLIDAYIEGYREETGTIILHTGETTTNVEF